MKLLLAPCVAMLAASCQTAEQERSHSAPLASLATQQLWSVGYLQAAIQELYCDGMSRREAERGLKRDYGPQERRIAVRLGEKNAPEIILTLPPCSHFRGAVDRYAESLNELEKRLSDQ